MFLGVTVDMINPQFTLFDWGWEERGVWEGGGDMLPPKRKSGILTLLHSGILTLLHLVHVADLYFSNFPFQYSHQIS